MDLVLSITEPGDRIVLLLGGKVSISSDAKNLKGLEQLEHSRGLICPRIQFIVTKYVTVMISQILPQSPKGKPES
jgi:hypothetical protein